MIAGGVMLLYVNALTLAPYVRYQTWEMNIDFRPWVGFGLWLFAFVITQLFASRFLPDHDPVIIPVVFILTGIGILTIWRISPDLGIRQNLWLIAGSLGFLLIIWFPNLFEVLRRYRVLWMVAILALVLLTILPGVLEKSIQPSLWINIAGFTFQPSEPLKLILIIYLAAYFADRLTLQTASWAAILPTIFMIGLGLMLLLLQRDLGTASLLLVLYVFMIFLVTKKRRVFLFAGAFFIIAMLVGYFYIEVVKLRIDSWINPWIDPTNRSYQVVQSIIGIASGGILGTGPGMGYPALVPVSVSDFIFAAISEELGFIGAASIIFLIIILFYRFVRAARFADDAFIRLLVSGAAILLSIQSLLIIGGNIRLFPLTGVTLPFISYGGSSLFTSMVMTALVLRTTQLRGQILPSDQIEVTLRKYVFPLISALLSVCILLLPVWSVILQKNLTQRSDNLRRSLNDSFVLRGTILDRNNIAINQSEGKIGEYQRKYLYPELSIVTGYADTIYGLSGVEQSLDRFLRGEEGYSALQIWWNKIIRSQPLPGLNVRLSLDLTYQNQLDMAMQDLRGAAVLLNSRTGEILGMSSSPNFDPTNLNENWLKLTTDKDSPLLNRAIAGKYPVGTSTGIFLYAQSIESQLSVPVFPADSVSYKGQEVKCSLPIIENTDLLKEVLQKSCPETNLSIARTLGKERMHTLYQQLGWYSTPVFALPHVEIIPSVEIENLKAASIGQEGLTISPLQMALAASIFSNEGFRPSPRLVQAYYTPDGTWELVNNQSESVRIFTVQTIRDVLNNTDLDEIPAWAILGNGISGNDHSVTWFVSGTNLEWKGTPLTLVIMAEDAQNNLILQKGKDLLRTFLLN